MPQTNEQTRTLAALQFMYTAGQISEREHAVAKNIALGDAPKSRRVIFPIAGLIVTNIVVLMATFIAAF
ncbi:hypothetical protein SAMN04488005_3112 [Yoonia tamlensis]|uniref:Uncharacterized protein n=1 Tax=Yoonia tamlensis TaxID=390270 RepID=A0A1I6HY54_9RHOB|nr:hypothetical protein [Yoonia tamlensis]SFR59373.1 hypothetical protein SAMN04488005_3112 [Yoonia tamlensis]